MKNDFFDDYPKANSTGPHVTVQNAEQSRISLPQQPPTGRRVLKITLIIILALILGAGGFVVVRATNLTSKIFVGKKSSFYNKLSQLVRSATGRDAQLIGESDDQINILLLGIGGAGHDGAYLSDTMILAQIKPQEHKVSMISIPRDYLADLGPGYGQLKINAAFAYGYDKHKDYNEAGEAATAQVEKLSGLTIPYFAVVDFKGFEEAINIVGGVDVSIDRTFTDYSYPDENEGYLPPVTFKAGNEHMDGKRALIFARSRHAAGPEGSDFSRSVRQQKVIQATKEKVTGLNLVTDSGKLNSLLSVLGDHFHTNIQLDEMLHLYSLSKDFSKNDVVSLSLDPSTKLICPQILESNGAYVLSPCPGKKLSDIQNFFQNSFDQSVTEAEKAVIWLADSNAGQKYYSAAAKQLSAEGLTVYQIGFTGKTLSQTVFYQVNKKAGSADVISDKLKATEVTLPPPGVKIDQTKVDIVVILGQDYKAPTQATPPTPTISPPISPPQTTN